MGPVVTAGAVVGGLCLFRSEAVAMAPLAAVWLWAALRRTVGAATGRRLAAAFLVTAAVVPSAWLVRNAVAFGRPVPTIMSTGGFALWMGYHDGATGSQKSYVEPADLKSELAAVAPTKDYELERDAVYRRHAVEYLKAEPGEALAANAKKFLMLVTFDFYDDRARNPVSLLGWLALAALGLAGATRRPPPAPARGLLLGYAGFTLVLTSVLFVVARYRLPIEMVLMVLAAGLVARWVGEPDGVPQ
ncbi:MAG: hypothetical protein ACRD0D_14430, partial [Acidimicrobiales bacterium]